MQQAANEQNQAWSAELLNRLVANAPDVLYSLTFTEPPRIDFISKNVQPITGYPAESILSDNNLWRQTIHPEDRELISETFQICKRSAQPFEIEYRLLRKDGSVCKVLDRANIQIEIWERGAGYTLASGSSSSAAAAVAHKLGLCDSEITVHMPGGQLHISIKENFFITMTGGVTKVSEGIIYDEMFEQPID